MAQYIIGWRGKSGSTVGPAHHDDPATDTCPACRAGRRLEHVVAREEMRALHLGQAVPRARQLTRVEMKFRRTAAVALVGWYLMVAPMHQSGFWSRFGMRFGDTNAPLNKWSIVGTFDTVRQCEAALSKRTPRQREARCVASDDPRLAR
jgi:hypothetical protein